MYFYMKIVLLNPFLPADRYIGIMMNFFGVPSFDGLIVEGHNAEPNKAQQIKEDAIARAKEAGKSF